MAANPIYDDPKPQIRLCHNDLVMDLAKEVSCPPPCSFRVRSEKEDEVVTMVQQHAKNSHQKDVSRSDVLGMVKTV